MLTMGIKSRKYLISDHIMCLFSTPSPNFNLVTACRLFSPKIYLIVVNKTSGNKLHLYANENTNVFVQPVAVGVTVRVGIGSGMCDMPLHALHFVRKCKDTLAFPTMSRRNDE